jgi:hypothetical protein
LLLALLLRRGKKLPTAPKLLRTMWQMQQDLLQQRAQTQSSTPGMQ